MKFLKDTQQQRNHQFWIHLILVKTSATSCLTWETFWLVLQNVTSTLRLEGKLRRNNNRNGTNFQKLCNNKESIKSEDIFILVKTLATHCLTLKTFWLLLQKVAPTYPAFWPKGQKNHTKTRQNLREKPPDIRKNPGHFKTLPKHTQLKEKSLLTYSQKSYF